MQLKGNLLFLAATILSTALFILGYPFLAMFLSIWLILRLFFAQSKVLVFSCFLVLLVGSFWLRETKIKLDQATQLQPKTTLETKTLVVQPDSIEVEGELLRFTGTNHHQRYRCTYYLKSKQEQEFWQKITECLNIQVTGNIKEVQPVRNLNGFDEALFLKTQKMNGNFQATSINIITPKKKHNFFQHIINKIHEWRRKCKLKIEQSLSSYAAVYIEALILGFKEDSFNVIQKNWQSLGLLYLFSMSGMQIQFLLRGFRYICLRIGLLQEWANYLEYGCLLFLGLFLGGKIAANRVVCQLFLRKINRNFKFGLSESDLWSITFIFFVLVNPYLLLSAAGQLSFIMPFLSFFIYEKTKDQTGWQMRFYQNFVLNALALPWMLYHFYEWNWLNILFGRALSVFFLQVLLPVSCGTIFVVLLGNIVPFHSLFLWISEQFFAFFHYCASFLAQCTWLQVTTGRLPLFLVIGILIGHLIWLLKQQQASWKRVKWLLFSILVISSWKYLNPSGVIAFVDIGQGDALFIQLPFHRGNFLIDTGGALSLPKKDWQKRLAMKSNADYTLIPFLKSQGVKKLDQVFITHADADHMGDLLSVSHNFFIKKLYYPKGTTRKNSFRKVATELQQTGTICQADLAPATLRFQQLNMEVLYPLEEGKGENNDSLVLFVSLLDRTFLLTGDLEAEGEKVLLNRYPNLQVDILKVGHHGSKTSSSNDFIAQIKPKISIISCGVNNRFGHPHEQTLDTLNQFQTRIYRTDQAGMIYLKWNIWSKQLTPIQTIRNNNKK